MALTIEQIHEAADNLSEQGIKPTMAKVREALGGKGSFTTINEAMKTWKATQTHEEMLLKVDLPSELNERLQATAAILWESAQDIANERLNAERQAMKAAQDQAVIECEEAQEVVKLLENEALEQSQVISDLQSELRKNTATSETTIATLKDSISQIQETNKSLADALTIEETSKNAIGQQLEQALQKIAELEQQKIELAKDNATLQGEQMANAKTIERMQHDLSVATKQINDLQATKGDLQGQIVGKDQMIEMLKKLTETPKSSAKSSTKAKAPQATKKPTTAKPASKLVPPEAETKNTTAEIANEQNAMIPTDQEKNQ